MRRFGLVGVALVLLANSASAQNVVNQYVSPNIVNVTTIRDCCTRSKTTIITPAVTPTLDQLPARGAATPVGGGPSKALCCMLADQPALLCELGKLDLAMAGYVAALRTGLNDLPVPKAVDEKKPEEKKPEARGPALNPTAMQTMNTKDWDAGRGFTDANGRRWQLLKGCALASAQPNLRGWLLESDGKRLYFLDAYGNLYGIAGGGPLP